MIYIDPRLHPSLGVREQLLVLAQELDRPMRFLHGRGRTYPCTPDGWSYEEAELAGVNMIEAQEVGLTVVLWGSPHHVTFSSIVLGETQAATEAGVGARINDTLHPTSTELAEPYALGDVEAWAEIGDRVVYFPAITTLMWFDGYLDFEAAFVNPIHVALDEDTCVEAQRRITEAQREAFMVYARASTQQRIETLRSDVKEQMRIYSQAIRSAANAKHNARQQQRQLDVMLADADGDASAKLLESWEKLQDDERIESVRLISDYLQLDTVELTLEHPIEGRVVSLGKFRWTIHLDDGSTEVRNLTNARGGHDHPHVHNGRPCFGDMGLTIHTLLRQGDIYPAVEMIFVFLSSVNYQDDWGRTASYWFDAPPDEERLAEPEASGNATDFAHDPVEMPA